MKTLLIVMITTVTISFSNADIVAIDFDHLTRFDSLRRDLIFLEKNYRDFEYWTPNWDYDLNKKDAIRSLDETANDLQKLMLSSSHDIDLTLLLLTVYQYQYNLLVPGSKNKFDSLMKMALIDFPNDYRPLWFEAEFFGNEGHLVDAVKEYQLFIQDRNDLQSVHPKALYDYAYVCSEAGLFRTSTILLKNFAKRMNIDLESIPIYQSTRKNLLPSFRDGTYNAKDCWQVHESRGEEVVSSDVFGFSTSNPKTWKTNLSDYSNSVGVLRITPPAIVGKLGEDITMHFAISANASITSLDDGVKYFLAKFGKKLNLKYISDRTVSNIKFRIYQVSSSKLYKEHGGLYGYAAFAENEYSEDSGFNLGIPRNLDQKLGTSYYRAVPHQDRIPCNLGYLVIVDSCLEIRTQTNDLFVKFLNGLKIR